MGRGRPPKLNDEQVKYIRENPERYSNKELALKFGVTPLTIIRVKHKRGPYAEGGTD